MTPARHALPAGKKGGYGVSRFAARAAAAVVFFIPGLSRAAGHSQPICSGPRIIVTAELDARWRRALQAAREALSTRPNLDRCAAVALTPSDAGMHVQVDLADGRAASRNVRDAEALAPTLDALLSLPEEEAMTPLTSGGSLEEPESTMEKGAPRRSVQRVHFEAGVGAMSRVAAPPLYASVGLAAFAQVSLDPWLAGVTARWDATDELVTESSPSGFNMQTLGLGVAVGARSEHERLTLDTTIGPEILAENQEAFGGDANPDGIGGGVTDFRLDLSLRLSTSSGAIRFFAQADADASPSRLRRQRQLDPGLPTLPSWSMGLALGAACGTP